MEVRIKSRDLRKLFDNEWARLSPDEQARLGQIVHIVSDRKEDQPPILGLWGDTLKASFLPGGHCQQDESGGAFIWLNKQAHQRMGALFSSIILHELGHAWYGHHVEYTDDAEDKAEDFVQAHGRPTRQEYEADTMGTLLRYWGAKAS